MALRFTLLVLAMVFTTPSVTGITMTVTPSSNTLTEGQSLRIQCRENSLPKNILLMELYRNNQRMVSWGLSETQEDWDTDYTGPRYETRDGVEVTGSVTSTDGSLGFFINNTQCADSAVFHCKVVSAGTSPVTQTQNITVNGMTQLPTMSGGDDCNNFNSECDNCMPADPNAPKPMKYVRKGERLVLVCSGQVGLTVTRNNYQWSKKTDRDNIPVTIRENITTDIQPPSVPSACYTNHGRSTLEYHYTDLDRDLVITCQILTTVGGTTTTRAANVSVCIEGFASDKTTPRPGGNAAPATAGLGGGEIAGIVIAVIAVIVLVVVLVYFLWYRRRDSGESYSTRETDVVRSTGPPVSSKPQHNSNYDTTGDDHQNSHYPSRPYQPGKVNEGMEDEFDNTPYPRSRDPIGSSV